MDKPENFDQIALNAAKQYMGGFAWPTVLLGLTVAVAYVATPILVVAGQLPLLAAVPLMAILTNYWRKHVRVAYRATRQSLSRLNGFLQERLTGLDVVHLFRRETRSSSRDRFVFASCTLRMGMP